MIDVRRILVNGLHYEKTGLVNEAWDSHVSKWRQWYYGKTAFHTYDVYNGDHCITCKRKSLRMPKKLSEDKADLLLNERVDIRLQNTRDQAAFDKVLERNNFFVQGNQTVEYSQALGTCAWVTGIVAGEIQIDYINDPSGIWPISWSNGQIRECAFAKVFMDSQRGEICVLSEHLLNRAGNYFIRNTAWDRNYLQIPLPQGVAEYWTKHSTVPMFQIVKPNIANNIMPEVPMGVSIYANNIDLLKVLDAIYDSYFNEFILGRKRIFVDGSVLNWGMTMYGGASDSLNGGITGADLMGSCARPVFDPNDAVFYNYPGLSESSTSGSAPKPILESNMELRVDEHQKALQAMLDLLSENAGFGKGYYKMDIEYVQTATAVISQNSKLFRKIRKDELVLNHSIVGLAQSILLLLNKNTNQHVNVIFDDSIIEDQDALIRRTLLELQGNAIDQVVYLQEAHGLTEEEAIRKVQEMDSRKYVRALEAATNEIDVELEWERRLPTGQLATRKGQRRNAGPGQGFRSDIYGQATNTKRRTAGDDSDSSSATGAASTTV